MIKDIILGVWETIVLIETLWNVNCERSYFYEMRRRVLIETLWNVNETSDLFQGSVGSY